MMLNALLADFDRLKLTRSSSFWLKLMAETCLRKLLLSRDKK